MRQAAESSAVNPITLKDRLSAAMVFAAMRTPTRTKVPPSAASFITPSPACDPAAAAADLLATHTELGTFSQPDRARTAGQRRLPPPVRRLDDPGQQRDLSRRAHAPPPLSARSHRELRPAAVRIGPPNLALIDQRQQLRMRMACRIPFVSSPGRIIPASVEPP